MENRYAYAHSSNTKKNKVIWTPDLHKKFLEAVEKIGVNEAVPKKILELMKVEGLTRDHVASHLQKYRIYLKKIADANNQVQISSKPSLLESSMINGDSWKNSPLMLNQPTPQHNNFQSYKVMNPPVLDTSSFSFPVLEAACFNTGTSCKPAHDTWSLPNQGYPMQPSTTVAQTIPGGLERERKLITGDPELGVMSSVCINSSNSSNSSVKHNLDGLMCDYGGSTIDLYPHVSTQKGSSGDFYPMNHENPSPNGFKSNCFSHDGFVEQGSFYGCNSNEKPTYSSNEMEMNTDPSNLEDVIGEDDLTLDVTYISSLWETFFPEESSVDGYGESGSSSNNVPVTYNPPYEDMSSQNLPNKVSFDSINNEGHVNKQQHSNGQPIEFVEDDVDLQTLIWDSSVQD